MTGEVTYQWYRVRLSAEQLAAGEKRKLAKQAAEAYLAHGKPAQFAVFATGMTAEGHVDVFFSPEAASRMESMVRAFDGQPCEKPSDGDLAMVAGDLSERHELLG